MSALIYYTVQFPIACEAILRKSFGESQFRLSTPSAVKTHSFSVQIEAAERLAIMEEGGMARPVAPIVASNVREGSFFYGFVATFVPSGSRKPILDHVALTILQSMPGGDLGAIFRADWHPSALSDADSKHAQPHWHFVQRPTMIENIVRTLYENHGTQPSEELDEFSFESFQSIFGGEVEIEHFHFAMSPLWEKDNARSSRQEFPTNKEFEAWFAALTTYVLEQLEYICLKSAPPSTSSAPNFQPTSLEQVKEVGEFILAE